MVPCQGQAEEIRQRRERDWRWVMLVVQVLLSGSWGNHLRWAYLGADPAHSESPGCGYCGMEFLVSTLVFGTLIPSLHSQKQNVNDVEQKPKQPQKIKTKLPHTEQTAPNTSGRSCCLMPGLVCAFQANAGDLSYFHLRGCIALQSP